MTASKVIAALAAGTAVAVFFMAPPDGAPAGIMRAAAVVILTIGLLVTVALPEFLMARCPPGR